jgi:hypothetical protein
MAGRGKSKQRQAAIHVGKDCDDDFLIKVCGKFNRRHMVDIPSTQFFAQRRYRVNRLFVDGHYRAGQDAVYRPSLASIHRDCPIFSG